MHLPYVFSVRQNPYVPFKVEFLHMIFLSFELRLLSWPIAWGGLRYSKPLHSTFNSAPSRIIVAELAN
jgi:hypothetical protein